MRIKCVFVFLSIHLLKQISILDAYTIPCNASIQTISRVTACPSTNSSYEAAAAKKNCLTIATDNQQCESFEYHCVLSDDMTHAVEVCAPYLNIIGNVCARFSSKFKSIIRIEERNCIDCPYSYNSTNAFQYQECYVNLSQTFTTQLPLSTTAEDITAAGINDDKELNDGDSHMVIVIVILAAIFVVIAVTIIVAVVKRHKIRKHFKCLKDHTDEIEMDNRGSLMSSERTSDPLLPEQNTQNNGISISGELTSDPSIPEEQNAPKTGISMSDERTSDSLLSEQNAHNSDANINEKNQPLIKEHAENGGSEYTEQSEENTDSPRLPKSIKQITPGHDIQHTAVLKTKTSTTKKDNILLQIMVNNLLNTLKNPTESWTKDDLVGKVDDMQNRLYEREEIDLLADFCKAINEDKNINNTLRNCQKEIFEILDSLEKKYHAKINVSDGCVCFTFYFDTDNDLQSFLVKVQEGQEELRKDISDLLLNKTLMEVFHVDSIYANLVISKVTANKGSVLVYQKDFLKSTTTEDDMTAEGNIEDVILKKDIPESQKIELESNFDYVLSSMKNPESMQETDLKTLVEEIVYEVIANKSIDLLTQIATAYEEEETHTALHKHGANMHRILIPIFEDVNLILNIFRKGHLMITEKDIEAYDEAVANRFRSSQISQYLGYRFCNTRALSFCTATKWMKSRKQEFAKFGFFYKGIDLSTICFHCGCLKDGWTKEDDILATHLSLTESCEYANYMISALPLPF